MRRATCWSAAAALVLAASQALAQSNGILVTNPNPPQSRESLSFELSGANWPMYLPATRYSRTGNVFDVEIEYLRDNFGPNRPDVGMLPIPVGELAPGAYTLRSRLYDLANPQSAPEVHSSTFEVIPSDSSGVFLLPLASYETGVTDAIVVSPFYLYPSSAKVTASAGTVRIEFEFVPGAWATPGLAPPPGTRSWVSVRLPALAAGAWRLEANGKGRDAPDTLTFVPIDFQASSAQPVVEYYAPSTDHYFVTSWPAEIARLDSGAEPGWKRTGSRFAAWPTQAAAPAQARPVCRFYASGPNSHFYTANAAECQWLRDLEAQGRAQSGASFSGWAYEGVAFWTLAPAGGGCPGGTEAVLRSFNNRAAQNDSNHRFTTSAKLHVAMAFSGVDEGTAFCSPR